MDILKKIKDLIEKIYFVKAGMLYFQIQMKEMKDEMEDINGFV